MREFYANMFAFSLSVFVRGKTVQFRYSSIKCFYELLNINNDEYSNYMNGKLNLKQVQETIGRLRAQWTMRGD